MYFRFRPCKCISGLARTKIRPRKYIYRGLIFVLWPGHIIAVAYCPRLLLQCPELVFWALRNENKTQWKFPTIRYSNYYTTNLTHTCSTCKLSWTYYKYSCHSFIIANVCTITLHIIMFLIFKIMIWSLSWKYTPTKYPLADWIKEEELILCYKKNLLKKLTSISLHWVAIFAIGEWCSPTCHLQDSWNIEHDFLYALKATLCTSPNVRTQEYI